MLEYLRVTEAQLRRVEDPLYYLGGFWTQCYKNYRLNLHYTEEYYTHGRPPTSELDEVFWVYDPIEGALQVLPCVGPRNINPYSSSRSIERSGA
jgi:hypothetical protein